MYQTLLWRGLYFFSVFLLNILFARFYQASGSSAIYYLINLYSFVLLIASFSMESGMSYFLAKKEVDETVLSALSVGWTLLFSVFSLLLLRLYFQVLDSDAAPKGFFLLTASTYIPGQLLITFFTPLFYARDSARLPNILLMAVNWLLILLIAVAHRMPSFIDHGTYLSVYFFGVLAQGLALAGVFWLRYGRGQRLSMPSPVLLKKIVRYSLIAFAANIIFFLVYRIDYWFVKRYCTADELGNYIQVSKLGQLLLVMPGILAGAIFPRTARATETAMPSHLARMARMAVLFFFFLFILLLCGGRSLFPLVFGPSFDKMYAPMLILLPGILFLWILTLLSAWFGGLHRPGVNARAALAGLIFMIAGDLLVIPRYGIIGAATISSLGYFVCMLYSLLEFTKKNRIGLGSMLIIKKEDWRWLLRQAGEVNR